MSIQGWVPPTTTYQWNDSSGPISGATSSTYSADVSDSYTLTITNVNGCTATSSAEDVTIVEPATPVNLSTTSIGLDRATMNWDATSNTNHYEIRFRAAVGGTWQILTSTSTSRTKYGLSSGTDYEWQVRSACSWSSSSFSAWSSIVSLSLIHI